MAIASSSSIKVKPRWPVNLPGLAWRIDQPQPPRGLVQYLAVRSKAYPYVYFQQGTLTQAAAGFLQGPATLAEHDIQGALARTRCRLQAHLHQVVVGDPAGEQALLKPLRLHQHMLASRGNRHGQYREDHQRHQYFQQGEAAFSAGNWGH